ncbi:hypothetical protein [Desulfocurvibacter africanus]|uniref:Uncharacterized protein n=1 Tax=Desulfocurvibacter africanus subsp. africanus str. Walvis Bay TaxID=690850 RepID=F3Z456_DESAF|nr:hypothetical protein [Desulfocurvibacter africanus]EGJ51598.1 hypothetical protein Desaf_3308 [Desulfocurvibacter africanus subsp. africanus str. Walvis Bay]
MQSSNRPLNPVMPVNMEIIFLYPCPYCGREVPLISPTSPAMAQCDVCRKTFPIVPVDARTIQYLKLVTANGQASIDPDFL